MREPSEKIFQSVSGVTLRVKVERDRMLTFHQPSLMRPPVRHPGAVAVALDPDPLDVDHHRRRILVVEGVLRVGDCPRHLRDDAGEGVASLVEVEALDAGLARVSL
jgi:hypothetical protein